jgi:hypothetical protein
MGYMAQPFDVRETIPQLWIRCAISVAFALCLALYLLINRSFDHNGLIILILGALPWLVLFFEQLEFAGFKIKAQVEQNAEDIKTIAMLMRSVAQLASQEVPGAFDVLGGERFAVVPRNPG